MLCQLMRRKFMKNKGMCIWGYHSYKEIQAALVGEELVCAIEPENTVAVTKNEEIVRHLWRKLISYI